MVNSRKKGNKGERDVAKILEKWTGKKFARSPSSGGLSWKNSMAKGDVVCTTEGHYFPFCVECKVRNDVTVINDLISSRKKAPLLTEFWEQCTRDARDAGKIPLLIFRYRGLPKGEWLVCVPQDIGLKLFPKVNHYISVKSQWGDFYLVSTTSLLEVSYKHVKKTLKNNKKWLKNW